jgi:hypothetical protein
LLLTGSRLACQQTHSLCRKNVLVFSGDVLVLDRNGSILSETIAGLNGTVFVLGRNVPVEKETVAVSDEKAPVLSCNDRVASEPFLILEGTVPELSVKFPVECGISLLEKIQPYSWSFSHDRSCIPHSALSTGTLRINDEAIKLAAIAPCSIRN